MEKLKLLSAIILAVVLTTGATVYAQVIRPSGDFLQPGDVESSHILNGTIVDADVNSNAKIGGKKIATNGTTGTLLLTDGTNIATTTSAKFATSTATLYLFGGSIHATSTNFNGVSMTWPAADGAAGTVLSTDGAGTYSYTSPSSSSITTNLTAGEDLIAGDTVFIATSTTPSTDEATFATSQTGGMSMGQCPAAGGDVAQSFTESSSLRFNQVTVNLAKSNSPTDSVVVSIETDSAGVPSGTQLASTTIAAATLTASQANYTLPLNDWVQTTASTKYWLRLSRSGSCDTTNSYGVGQPGSSPYANGTTFRYNGTSWGDQTLDIYAKLTRAITPGALYVTSASAGQYSQFLIGVVSTSVGSSSSATVVVGGTATGLSGLTAGVGYYLSNTRGAIAATAGTISKKIGIALSATTLLLGTNW